MNLTTRFVSPLLIILSLTFGFNSSALAAEKQAKVFHVVMCWLKDSGSPEARNKLIAASEQLQEIPGVISVSAGEMLPSPRPIVDSSYDVGIIMRFESVAAMQSYLQNPLHKKAAKEFLIPLTSKVVIYDFALPN